MHRLLKIRIVRDFERLEEHKARRHLEAVLEARPACVSFRPAVDFYETTQGLLLRMELAGVEPQNVSLFLAGQELIIRGRRQPLPPEGLHRFIHLEMGFGSFERCFRLPIPIDPRGVEARFADGILEVRLPRKGPRSRTVPVKITLESE